MGREKEGYYGMMEQLNRKMPDKELLSKREAAEILGISYSTALRRLRFNAFGKITKADLARQVCVGKS